MKNFFLLAKILVIYLFLISDLAAKQQDYLNEGIKLFNKNQLFRLFNLTVLEANTKEGTIKVEFDVDEKFCNPQL